MAIGDVPPELVARAKLRIGTYLRGDKYLIESLLGIGGMGTVFGAMHRNGMRVAIKVLHPELSRMEEVRRRFLREGYLANKVEHPGIVRVLDDDVDGDETTFLVMELLLGRTLDEEWEKCGRRVSVAQTADVALRLLDVLSAVHAEGIIHRDIKPENVFLTQDGKLKLLDLGIARLVDSRTITATGQQMGTPEFMAPEQASGNTREVDARSDLYSLGALMFTLLTGKPVHEARTSMERMIFAATKPARSIFDVWPQVPPALANVIDVALDFDKMRRWSSAREMYTALERTMELINRQGAPPSIAVASTEPQPRLSTGTLIAGRMTLNPSSDGDHDSAIPLVKKP
jgi:eukaryotic-like serine/threonine-protein kinase